MKTSCGEQTFAEALVCPAGSFCAFLPQGRGPTALGAGSSVKGSLDDLMAVQMKTSLFPVDGEM